MNSRKTLLREQKILEFIDDKVVTSRLNYPNIRDRINFSIGEKELVKNKLFLQNCCQALILTFSCYDMYYGVFHNDNS